MSTLAEIEAAVPRLTEEELLKLERLVRQTRRGPAGHPAPVAFDLPPLQLGQLLRPLGGREEWYDEMLEGRV